MFKQMIDLLSAWLRLHNDARRLGRIDDRLLADMGIERDDIAVALRHGRRPRSAGDFYPMSKSASHDDKHETITLHARQFRRIDTAT